MSQSRIVIVHPDPSARAILSSMLKSLRHVIDEAANDRVVVRLLEQGGVNMIVAGVKPVDPEALELLAYVRWKYRDLPVILLFPGAHPERTKEALRLGARAVLRDPVSAHELRAAVTQALEPVHDLHAAVPVVPLADPASPNHRAVTPPHLGDGLEPDRVAAGGPTAMHATEAGRLARQLGLLGHHPSWRQAIELAGAIAPARTPVLILGERGTGKSCLARTIHKLGSRPDQPFVTADCATLTEAALDRQRDVQSRRTAPRPDAGLDGSNKLVQAQGGTLFLNDIAALSAPTQLQLLRALQDREHGRGDVRFLMSAGDNLATLVEQATFRRDLYQEASVICLRLTPLRHRGTDIEALAEYFLARSSRQLGKHVAGFDRAALVVLNEHDWPGNVRELKDVIRRAVALCEGTRITADLLSPGLHHPHSSRSGGQAPRPHRPLDIRPLTEALEEPERRIIVEALQALNGNRRATARVLGIDRTTLYRKMKKHALLVDEPAWRPVF
jgi:two-component system response regulator HydG